MSLPTVRIVAAVALATLLGLAGSVGAGASPARSEAVTMAEFRRTHVGMERARVHAIFDARGRLVIKSGSGEEIREYALVGEDAKLCFWYAFRQGSWRVWKRYRDEMPIENPRCE